MLLFRTNVVRRQKYFTSENGNFTKKFNIFCLLTNSFLSKDMNDSMFDVLHWSTCLDETKARNKICILWESCDGILITFSLISRNKSCPDGTFITKHLDILESYGHPRVDGKAAAERVALRTQGARAYRGWQGTNINHIFLTKRRAMSTVAHYEYVGNGNVCKTRQKVDTYECTFGRVWDCTYKGELYSYHDLVTGHLWATS